MASNALEEQVIARLASFVETTFPKLKEDVIAAVASDHKFAQAVVSNVFEIYFAKNPIAKYELVLAIAKEVAANPQKKYEVRREILAYGISKRFADHNVALFTYDRQDDRAQGQKMLDELAKAVPIIPRVIYEFEHPDKLDPLKFDVNKIDDVFFYREILKTPEDKDDVKRAEKGFEAVNKELERQKKKRVAFHVIALEDLLGVAEYIPETIIAELQKEKGKKTNEQK